MLPWRRQGSRSQVSDSDGLDLQSAATLPPLLPGGAIPTDLGGGGALAGSVGAAGSLRHSYSCPPSAAAAANSSNNSKGSQQQHSNSNSFSARRPPISSMVRMSADAALLTDGGSPADNSSQDAGDDPEQQQQNQLAAWGALQAYHGPSAAGLANGGGGAQHHHHQIMSSARGHASPGTPHSQHHPHHQHHQQQPSPTQAHELERRKFTRNLLSANNKKESLERYKAIMALIEACRRRLEEQLGPAGAAAALAAGGAAWCAEPLLPLLQAVLDVGEALASFGNCHFPEHSNEARAILAGDYRALLRRYLSSFGFLFAEPTRARLSRDAQDEVQCVGSLLATRCEAYDLLYGQLVKHVGLEGRGGPQTFILNHNSAAASPATTITANPVNSSSAAAAATSKARASMRGLGAAAAALFGGVLLLRGVRGGRARRGSTSTNSSQQQQPGGRPAQQLRVPKGRNGRELLLVSQLSGCADELRRAAHNEELLRDDWRLGRHVRLAWPPGPPVPPGYEPVGPDACNVTQLLQELYS